MDSASESDEKKRCEKIEECGQPTVKKPGQKPKYKIKDKGGDYLIEINGNVLNVYGQGALRFIDRPWNPSKAKEVTLVKFSCLEFNLISQVLGRIKQRFPNAESYYFSETNISWLGQLNALADIQGLTSLTIHRRGNPIADKEWRSYAIYRLSHWGLKTINDSLIKSSEVAGADAEYRGLSEMVAESLPENLLVPLLERLQLGSPDSASTGLDLSQPSLRAVVAKEALQWRKNKQEMGTTREKGRASLEGLLSSTVSTVVKLRLLKRDWEEILRELVRDTLVDYSHLDSYMKQCIAEIQI